MGLKGCWVVVAEQVEEENKMMNANLEKERADIRLSIMTT